MLGGGGWWLIINGTGLLELSLPRRREAEGVRRLCCVILIDMD